MILMEKWLVRKSHLSVCSLLWDYYFLAYTKGAIGFFQCLLLSLYEVYFALWTKLESLVTT